MLATPKILESVHWKQAMADHKDRVQEWTTPYKKRRSKTESHPVHDFLFSYYSYSIGRLESWHPPAGTHLEFSPTENKHIPSHFSENYYTKKGGYLFLDPTKSVSRLNSHRWILQLLEHTQKNKPIYGCYGMHEWAMVYKLSLIHI